MKTILVVEDDRDVARVLELRLHQVGYYTLSARDGVMAVEVAQKYCPDLILLDLMLPGGGGLKVLERVKLLMDTSTIPVIVVSGMLNVEYLRQVHEQGINGFFNKPYNPKDLLDTIKDVFVEREDSLSN